MTLVLWVLAGTAIALTGSLAMLSWALYQVVRAPIRVIDVTPEPEPVYEIAAAEALERAEADGPVNGRGNGITRTNRMWPYDRLTP